MQRFVAPVLSSVALFALGCAGSIESAVHGAHESSTVPNGLVVSYDDRAPLLGGDRIEVTSDGNVRWWTDVPAPIDAGIAPEDSFDDVGRMPEVPTREPDRAGTVDADALHALVALLDAIAPWKNSPDDEDDARLERRRAFLTVVRGDSRESTWQWADPTESGENRITAIRRWAERYLPRPVPVEPVEPVGEEPTGPNPLLTNP